MDFQTKIKLLFDAEGWTFTEYALVWVFSDPATNRAIQVAKDLSQIDIISPNQETLFSILPNGKYKRKIGDLQGEVRTDEMFRLLGITIRTKPPKKEVSDTK